MSRGPRLQYPNACYHVINRGNYRSDIFAGPATAAAFERCVFEACDLMGWVLYAHVVMRNHFHLAIRTPQPNLSQGMQWLEATFATRFNRLRHVNGHLFQGRFHSPLIEPGTALARVVNYIHLNPVRARVLPVEQLSQYRFGSFRRFGRTRRPGFLQRSEWLHTLGLSDNAEGWLAYQDYLAWLAADPAEQKRQGWGQLSTGWAIGGLTWRREIKQSYGQKLGRHLLSPEENAALNHAEWSSALDELLLQAGRTLPEAAQSAKGAPWKIQLAIQLRRTTSATIPWLASHLHLGAPSSLRVYLACPPTPKTSILAL